MQRIIAFFVAFLMLFSVAYAAFGRYDPEADKALFDKLVEMRVSPNSFSGEYYSKPESFSFAGNSVKSVDGVLVGQTRLFCEVENTGSGALDRLVQSGTGGMVRSDWVLSNVLTEYSTVMLPSSVASILTS